MMDIKSSIARGGSAKYGSVTFKDIPPGMGVIPASAASPSSLSKKVSSAPSGPPHPQLYTTQHGISFKAAALIPASRETSIS
jgi:hypothetical protein